MTALFAAAVFVALAFMYVNTKKELAPEEDQGVLFALTKAPQYANLDYADFYGKELDKAFTSIPEADLRFVVNGRFGPNQGIAGVILKPWNERIAQRPAAEADPARAGRQGRGPAGLRLLAAAAARLDRRLAGADGDQLDRRFHHDL